MITCKWNHRKTRSRVQFLRLETIYFRYECGLCCIVLMQVDSLQMKSSKNKIESSVLRTGNVIFFILPRLAWKKKKEKNLSKTVKCWWQKILNKNLRHFWFNLKNKFQFICCLFIQIIEYQKAKTTLLAGVTIYWLYPL